MEENYKKIDFEIIDDFVEGEVHDVYTFVKQLCFKDLYMSIYSHYFESLKYDDSLDKFIEVTYSAYRKQNKLNYCLRVSSGKYYDDYLMTCVIHELYKMFGKNSVLKDLSCEEFKMMIYEYDRNHIDNELMSEYNVNILTSMINNKFANKSNIKISDVISYINEIANNDVSSETEKDYFEYLNKLIARKNITLNQLGKESKIGKRIYDLSIDKLPTKNQLLMIIFTLRLNREEQYNLVGLLKERVKNTSMSNIYLFDDDSDRDKLLYHWITNITELDKFAKKSKKSIVRVLNDMLRQSGFEILS